MRLVTAVIATTHVDLHNERMAPSALEGMAEQIREHYIPVMWNHDLRYPPLGRTIDGRVVPMADGELALETESEYWESGDKFADLHGDGRVLVSHYFDEPGFEVRIDRGVSLQGDRQAALELAALGGSTRHPLEVGKKALEPDAVLVVAVGSIAGAVALGFFQRLGEDVYEQLKARLSRFVAERDRPLLIDFDITFELDGRKTLHVLLDGPSASDVEALFDGRFDGLDVLVDLCLARVPDMHTVVVTWVEGGFLLNYAVRQDGVPILIGRAIPELALPPD